MPPTSERPLRILLHSGGWTPNIGNAFLQLGAAALLHLACPRAEIYFASALPPFFLSERSYCVPGRDDCSAPDPKDALSTIAYGDYDVFVSAGMVLCAEYRRILEGPLCEAAGRGKKLLLLGAGALEYDRQEVEIFRALMDRLDVIGFRSRDHASYELYRRVFPDASSGIDCAWFLPEAYRPIALDLVGTYSVFSFHYVPEPKCAPPGVLLRSHHFVMDKVPCAYLMRGPVLLSDRPEDYLNLYAGAEQVHTDRVHAAVATLVYVRAARLYGGTPRAGLFEAAGAKQVSETLTYIDRDRLQALKKNQVRWLAAALEGAFRGATEPRLT